MTRPSSRLRAALAGTLFSVAAGIAAAPTEAADSAVVFMYHRFGESEWPATNIRMDQFQAHLEEIRSGGHGVLPLPEILERMRHAVDIPDRKVAMTVDDAYASAYARAWALFGGAGLTLTLFVSTASVHRSSTGSIAWAQVRARQAAGVANRNPPAP